MIDCSKDFAAFYREKVALAEAQRTNMRKRRNSTRKSLKSGLARDDEPKPIGSESQGSYAMRTMIQHPDNDYDIDDGVYFTQSSLVGPQGGDKSPANAKEMVRKALHSEVFKTPVAVLKNCVRVQYNEGYHVDVPVYRKVDTDENGHDVTPYYELASSTWKKSDPLAVTNWFKKANSDDSHDKSNGGQIRRIVRFLKSFAQSRSSWKSQNASGFMITKLVVDHYRGDGGRDDTALRNTMIAIRAALDISLEIDHPVLEGETITNGDEDARTKFFREKLTWALKKLEVLDRHDCSHEDALKAWDNVFAETFFSERLEESAAQKSVTAAAILRTDRADNHPDRAVNKRGNRQFG